ncbi:PQQ-binding-like beta-propeller repeat protein [Haloarcula marina]|uniref:outer membrane protein assembly factor BamB family protein n=1 Tax=Haloarcula marina TaxID=2961574 RepID=UPI0020B81DAC|nr:PQQ-binding-like beta-propeller repeat protein [Halomicroarcula marina]
MESSISQEFYSDLIVLCQMLSSRTRRSLLLGVLSLSAGCLRGSQPTDQTDEDTETDEPTGTSGGTNETPQQLGESAFSFSYEIGAVPPELTVRYDTGPALSTANLQLVVDGTTLPWAELKGSSGDIEPGQAVTLTDGPNGLDWPLTPAAPVSVQYVSDGATTVLGQFNDGGAAAMKSAVPSNTGRNPDVVGGTRVEEAWTAEVGRVIQQVAIRDGTVYYGTYDRHFDARSLETGELQWEFDAAAPDIVSDDATISTVPAVTDDAVYLGAGNSAVGYRLDRETGDVEWEAEIAAFSPTVVDGTVYIGGGSGVMAVDAESGDVLWQKGIGWVADGAVAVAEDKVIAATRNGLVCQSAETGEEEWVYFGAGQENPPNPVVDDGTVYGVGGQGSGTLFALDIDDGSESWVLDLPVDRVDRTPIVGTETIFVCTQSSRQGIFAVDRSSGDIQWRGENLYGMQAFASESSVYTAGNPDGVAALDATTGNALWEFAPDSSGDVVSPIAAAEGYVVYVEKSGDRYELRALRERGE